MRKLALALVGVLAVTARADDVDPADWSYQLFSHAGRAPHLQECHGPGACTATALDRRGKRLWTVDRALAPIGGTSVSEDGLFVVHVNELLPLDAPAEAEAFSIYARGRLVRRYLARELFAAPTQLPVLGGTHRWVKSWKLEKGRLVLMLLGGDKRAFGLADGRPG
jgi:hypothetical protein